VKVTTRRSEMVIQAMVVSTIRPDTIFIPYHWPGRRSANNLTHRTLDPRSKIPEYKVSACAIEKAIRPADLDQMRNEETGWNGQKKERGPNAPTTSMGGPGGSTLVTIDDQRHTGNGEGR
jgi:predicted molibdopterin-dependent oxidoreductase YjgC